MVDYNWLCTITIGLSERIIKLSLVVWDSRVGEDLRVVKLQLLWLSFLNWLIVALNLFLIFLIITLPVFCLRVVLSIVQCSSFKNHIIQLFIMVRIRFPGKIQTTYSSLNHVDSNPRSQQTCDHSFFHPGSKVWWSTTSNLLVISLKVFS